MPPLLRFSLTGYFPALCSGVPAPIGGSFGVGVVEMEKMAHPIRFERVAFAFGGQRSGCRV